MTQIDWQQGFKIESDGTCAGTKIYDHDGNMVPFLKCFTIEFDADQVRPKVTAVQYDMEGLYEKPDSPDS